MKGSLARGDGYSGMDAAVWESRACSTTALEAELVIRQKLLQYVLHIEGNLQ
jgi:hypothetical protein